MRSMSLVQPCVTDLHQQVTAAKTKAPPPPCPKSRRRLAPTPPTAAVTVCGNIRSCGFAAAPRACAMSIGPPGGPAWSLMSRPGSQPTRSAWTFPCCADKPWCLACGCERCIADKREHQGAASAVPRAAPPKAEPLPTVVLSATASSVPRPAPPEPEPLPSVASVPPPRWPPPPTELPPSVPQQASPEAQLLPAGKPDDQPKPWIISCLDCDDPEQADVCPRCDLPRCQSCENQGLCCNSPEAQSGRQRLQERQARGHELAASTAAGAARDHARRAAAASAAAV